MSFENASDAVIIHQALGMWQNFITTGDCCLSAKDAENSGQKELIKPLAIDQMRFIIRLEDLKNRIKL